MLPLLLGYQVYLASAAAKKRKEKKKLPALLYSFISSIVANLSYVPNFIMSSSAPRERFFGST